MKAMVLAAGIGSRLRPLTDRCPKALIEVGGKAMLEIVIERLKRVGVDGVIINTFHFPDQIKTFLRSRDNFGIDVEISSEEKLLDTGGALKNASKFFNDGAPFFMHNVDVISDVDLSRMYRFHLENHAIATLAVRSRASGRYLLFNSEGRLCGRENSQGRKWAGTDLADFERLAFDGIHVISQDMLRKITEEAAFPITQTYLRLAGGGEKIAAFRTDGSYWRDIGSMEKLKQARAEWDAEKWK